MGRLRRSPRRKPLPVVDEGLDNFCDVTGKAIFVTEVEACRKRPTVALHPYRCPHCKFWHLTSKEQR